MMVSLFVAIFSLSSIRTILRENGMIRSYYESAYIFNRKKFKSVCDKIENADTQKNLYKFRRIYLISFAVAMSVVVASLTLVYFI